MLRGTMESSVDVIKQWEGGMSSLTKETNHVSTKHDLCHRQSLVETNYNCDMLSDLTSILLEGEKSMDVKTCRGKVSLEGYESSD